MSVSGQFVIVPVDLLHQHLDGQQDLCPFIHGELERQPTMILDIGDHWHGANTLFDELHITDVTGEQAIELNCCESGFWISEAGVSLIAKELKTVSNEALQAALAAIDYDSIYHGSYLQEHPQELAATFYKIVALYDQANQSGQAMLFMIC